MAESRGDSTKMLKQKCKKRQSNVLVGDLKKDRIKKLLGSTF